MTPGKSMTQGFHPCKNEDKKDKILQWVIGSFRSASLPLSDFQSEVFFLLGIEHYMGVRDIFDLMDMTRMVVFKCCL